MQAPEVWEAVFWCSVGANVAYAISLLVAVRATKEGRRWPEAVNNATCIGTPVVAAWYLAYLLVGGWWSLLATPALFAVVSVCAVVCAYVREHHAKWRVTARERGAS